MGGKKGTLLPKWLQNNQGHIGINNYNKLETRNNYNDIQELHNARLPANIPLTVKPQMSVANTQRKLLNSQPIFSYNPSEIATPPTIKKPLDMMGSGTTGKFGTTKLSPIDNNKTIGVGKTGAVKIAPRQANGVDSVVAGFTDSATLGIANGLTNKLTGNKTNMNPTNNNFAYGAGKLLGYTIPYGAASKALSPVINTIKNPLLRSGARIAEGATTFALGGAIEAKANGKTNQEILKEAKTNALIGGGFGLVGEAIPAIAKGIKNLKERPQNIQNIFNSKFGEMPTTNKIINGTGLKGSFNRPQIEIPKIETPQIKINSANGKLKPKIDTQYERIPRVANNEPKINEVLDVPIGTKNVMVVKNPTSKDIQYFDDMFKEKLPFAPKGEPTTRQTFDVKGNKYVWMSDDSMHAGVESQLKSKYNLDTNQNIHMLEEPQKYTTTVTNQSTFNKPQLTSKLKPTSNIKVEGANTPIVNKLSPKLNTEGINTPPIPTKVVTSKYVDNKPLNFQTGKNDKQTSQSLRDAFTGKEGGQIVQGNHLADKMKKLAPNEQEGIQLYIDAGGDMTHLKEMANHADPIMDSFIPNTKTTYRDAYNQSLNLSPKALEAAKEAQIYYKESGAYALQTGSTQSVLDNYSNRMWVKEPAGVKTSIRNNGISPNTSHAKERVYETISEGLLNGKQPATLKANDLLAIHNQEMAHANTVRELASTLETNGLGQYSKDVPVGFKSVDGLSKHIPTADGYIVKPFVLPEKLANGLRAITDTDLTKKIDSLRGIQKYQGVVKTVDLAVSTFHHITLAAQALYNNKGGADFVKHWKDLKLIDDPQFLQSELDFARHTGVTTKVASNIDTLRKLTTKGSMADKITNLPILKQGKQLLEANNDLLFNKIQRWLKVTDYQNKVLDFVSKNPSTVNESLTKVKRDIAKEVNLAYGGLNWKSLGKNPSTLGIERMVFLAPDWTESSIRMIGKATENNIGGHYARQQYMTGLTGGLLLTEGLNHLLTGHFTDKNARGHELEVEVQPDVYVSLFRSGIGDATKLGSNMLTNGVVGGTAKMVQGKFAPFLRTGVGVAANVDYLGRKIYGDPKKTNLQNDANLLKYVATSAGPMPFGAASAVKYNQETPSKGKDKLIGNLLVDSGAGKYAKDFSQTGSTYDNPKKSYDGNWLRQFTAPTNEKSQIKLENKLATQKKEALKQTTSMNEELGVTMKKEDNVSGLITHDGTMAVLDKYNIPSKDRKGIISGIQSKLDNLNKSPLQQKFDSLSEVNQNKFYNTLSPEEKSLIKTKYKKTFEVNPRN